MNLLVQQLKAAIDDLARKKGIVGARVLDKRNQHGEVVIALILPRTDSAIPPEGDRTSSRR
ncbi:hypothetical protein BH09MYX1_BH09MYX1_59910 [soil metagenome]